MPWCEPRHCASFAPLAPCGCNGECLADAGISANSTTVQASPPSLALARSRLNHFVRPPASQWRDIFFVARRCAEVVLRHYASRLLSPGPSRSYRRRGAGNMRRRGGQSTTTPPDVLASRLLPRRFQLRYRVCRRAQRIAYTYYKTSWRTITVDARGGGTGFAVPFRGSASLRLVQNHSEEERGAPARCALPSTTPRQREEDYSAMPVRNAAMEYEESRFNSVWGCLLGARSSFMLVRLHCSSMSLKKQARPLARTTSALAQRRRHSEQSVIYYFDTFFMLSMPPLVAPPWTRVSALPSRRHTRASAKANFSAKCAVWRRARTRPNEMISHTAALANGSLRIAKQQDKEHVLQYERNIKLAYARAGAARRERRAPCLGLHACLSTSRISRAGPLSVAADGISRHRHVSNCRPAKKGTV
jgi:hypothetical protein